MFLLNKNATKSKFKRTMQTEKEPQIIKCLNLNHRCTGFDKGDCKIVNSVCVFQLIIIEQSNKNQNEKQNNLRD